MTAKLHSPQEIFALARRHPFYCEKLKAAGSFTEAPTTNKAELYAAITGQMEKGENKGLYLSPTGGSSANQLLFFPTDISENIFQRTHLSAYLNEAGIFKDAVALNLFGANMMYRSLEIFNYFCEAAGATTLPVSSGCDDASILALGQHFQANTIMGMPFRLMQFAQFIQTKNQSESGTDNLGQARPRLRLEHLIFAGETLSEQRKDYLTAAFGLTKISSIFGSAEAGIWAYHPYCLSADFQGAGHGYLYPLDMMYVEVLEPDQDGFGRLVLTNLIRRRNPLLRYDCGDRGRVSTITYGNRTMGLLEFAGRVQTSFQIGGNYFDLSEFKAITDKWLDYQFELTTGTAQQDLLRLLVVAENPLDLTAQLIQETTSELANVLQSNNDFAFALVPVSMQELTRSRTSGKVIRIVDRR